MSNNSEDLMRSAALDALDRLHGVSWQEDLATFYGPLTETLMWITALADRMGKIEQEEYSGLAYARNCVLHGLVIVSAVSTQQPREPSPLLGDVHRIVFLGPTTIWGFTDDPEPYDSSSGLREPNKRRRAAYNAHVAQHAVFPMMDDVLWKLGVNIWDGEYGLTPRRPQRQSSIPPGWVPPS